MSKEIMKMIKEWKGNYKIWVMINLSDIEDRVKMHKENGYNLEAFFLLLIIIEYYLRKLIMTRNLRLSILLELNNNPTFGYYIDFNENYLSLGKLTNAFKKFFKEETETVGLLRKFKNKRNNMSHFLIDKSEDGKRLLYYAVSEKELNETEDLKKQLSDLITKEHDKMNELQIEIDKKKIT